MYATKNLSHKGTQSIDNALYTLSESLSLCAFVAGLAFSEWTHKFKFLIICMLILGMITKY